MKIAWFTPYNKRSAIGKYSQVASKIIAKNHAVVLWVSQNEDELHEVNLPIIRYKPSDGDLKNRLNQFDMIIYNFGDNLKFHQDIFEVYRKISGLVILHDYLLHHFFLGYFYQRQNFLKQYLASIGLAYGDKAESLFNKSMNSRNGIPISDTDEIDKYPFFEPILINAKGVMVHSFFAKTTLEKKYPGSITQLNMPYNNMCIPTPLIPKRNTDESKCIRLLTVGRINSNKRIDKILGIIGKNKTLKDKLRYSIVGDYESDGKYFNYLKKIIKKYSLDNNVTFHGYLEEGALFQHIANADICVNLRYPVMSGGSWSLLDEFHAKKPIIVSDSGFFSEIPDDAVIKIPIDSREEKILEKKLLLLAANPKIRETIGKKGNRYSLQNNNEKQYLKKFNQCINSVKLDQETPLLLKVAEEVGTYTDAILNENEIFDTIDSVLKK